jgi:hypothetical protein
MGINDSSAVGEYKTGTDTDNSSVVGDWYRPPTTRINSSRSNLAIIVCRSLRNMTSSWDPKAYAGCGINL